MPANVEIKARAADVRRQRELAAALSDAPPEVIRQKDFFFRAPGGRLKLRVLGPRRGELIFYHREDRPEPKPSEYFLSATDSPDSLRQVLEKALGPCGTVRKVRTLYRSGRTRIHLDEVEGLGSFIELEVVLGPGEGVEEGIEEARRLSLKLGIETSHLVDRAYVDLLGESAAGPSPREGP
jgi:adenylate cyclase class IV